MVAKEWRDARWKLALAAVAILAFVILAPRSYEEIQRSVEEEIQMTSVELAAPERYFPPEEAFSPEFTRADYEGGLRRQFEEMRQPDYPAEQAWQGLASIRDGFGYLVFVPLAALLGVALVSGEVSQGTIFLLLSRPLSRTRIFMTKYLTGVAVLLLVALLGGVGAVVSGFAHGYPATSTDIVEVLASTGLLWLGTLSVLGVATLASVLFRDVIRSVIATVVACYAVISAPSWISEIASTVWLLTNEQDFMNSPMVQEGWYESFEVFRITRYWSFLDPYESTMVPYAVPPPGLPLSLLVCLVAAALPLIAALWIFRRRGY